MVANFPKGEASYRVSDLHTPPLGGVRCVHPLPPLNHPYHPYHPSQMQTEPSFPLVAHFDPPTSHLCLCDESLFVLKSKLEE